MRAQGRRVVIVLRLCTKGESSRAGMLRLTDQHVHTIVRGERNVTVKAARHVRLRCAPATHCTAQRAQVAGQDGPVDGEG